MRGYSKHLIQVKSKNVQKCQPNLTVNLYMETKYAILNIQTNVHLFRVPFHIRCVLLPFHEELNHGKNASMECLLELNMVNPTGYH